MGDKKILLLTLARRTVPSLVHILCSEEDAECDFGSRGSKDLKKSQIMASDASHMLEAALEQMDDIIAGTKSAAEYANGGYDIVSPAPSVYLGTFQILHLLEDLKMALEMLEDPQEKEALRNQIPGATAVCLREWFEENLSQVNHHSSNNETYQERLARLEGDKESLILQVSVLTDQVEAQGEKIRDLEICLEGHQLKLNATEEMLQQELLSRTSLETQKLDLMAEVSDLKIKLVGMEKEQSEYEEKQNKAESVVNLISDLQEQMCRLQLEINSRIQERKSQDRKAELTPNGPQSGARSVEPAGQKNCSQCEGLLQELRHLKIKVEELENERNQYEWKLKATKAEIAQLQEQLALKDAEIERLQSQLSRTSSYTEVAERDQEVQRLKIGMETLLAANEEKDRRIEELTLLLSQYRRVKDIMIAAHGSSVPGGNDEEIEATLRKWNLLNNSQGELLKTEQQSKAVGKGSKYQTLPGKLPRALQNGEQGMHSSPDGCGTGDNDDSSIPGLRETESMDGTVVSDDLSPLSSGTDSGPQSPWSPENRKSPKGIKKIWGNDHNAPFAQWSTERVCNWLEDFGLGQYVIFARQWVTSGHTLLTATPQDMEKEMGIKHPLHRKKLVLAIKAINAKQDEKSAQLDHIWVTRWLDDIGLPQYKDQFHESRVDGRMLQYLTVSNVSPSDVVQWSNHRVMEWLRSVDLAEYAPNLRGSGVHGGLIILEPRFNGDTLAMLLNIPPQKTLLRRHLTTNFNVLIGPEAQQEKREIMESAAYTPLTTTAKVRPKKLGFSHFGNLRKKKFDESTDYICPMDTSPAATNGTSKNYGGYKGLSPFTDRELDQVGQTD
ncbi:Liprin-beta-2 [Turdus rufiventris]|nr:Liprin-beta-2 [Turdus rufiventris]